MWEENYGRKSVAENVRLKNRSRKIAEKRNAIEKSQQKKCDRKIAATT